jgi:hypothetical protein
LCGTSDQTDESQEFPLQLLIHLNPLKLEREYVFLGREVINFYHSGAAKQRSSEAAQQPIKTKFEALPTLAYK